MSNNELIESLIEGFGDIAIVGSGPLAPALYGAKELLKYGYGFLADDYDRRHQYKAGQWYENPNYLDELYTKGGPSQHYVPLSPNVDPEAWTTTGRSRWQKEMEIEGDTGGFAPAPIVGPPELSPLAYGWTEHYAPQIPVIKINTSRGKVNLHPPTSLKPNATMIPSGGFSNYRKKRY